MAVMVRHLMPGQFVPAWQATVVSVSVDGIDAEVRLLSGAKRVTRANAWVFAE